MWDTIPTSFVLFPFCFVEYICTTRIVYNNFPVWKMRNLLVLDSLHSLILLSFPSLPEFHPESQEKDIADKYILLLWSDLWDSVQHTKGNTCCFCRCRSIRVERECWFPVLWKHITTLTETSFTEKQSPPFCAFRRPRRLRTGKPWLSWQHGVRMRAP